MSVFWRAATFLRKQSARPGHYLNANQCELARNSTIWALTPLNATAVASNCALSLVSLKLVSVSFSTTSSVSAVRIYTRVSFGLRHPTASARHQKTANRRVAQRSLCRNRHPGALAATSSPRNPIAAGNLQLQLRVAMSVSPLSIDRSMSGSAHCQPLSVSLGKRLLTARSGCSPTRRLRDELVILRHGPSGC